LGAPRDRNGKFGSPGAITYHAAAEPKRACYFGHSNQVVDVLGFTTINDSPLMGRIRHATGMIEWVPLAQLVISPNVVAFKPRVTAHA
jgi:hypothetical protein